MSEWPTAIDLKLIRHAVHPRLKTILVVATLLLLAATASTQEVTSGGRADRGPLSPDPNGAETTGQESRFTGLPSERLPRPFADASVSPAMTPRLVMAYETAIVRLRTEPGCRTLFQRLGADGATVLARTRYSCKPESRYCQSNVAAFTKVGSTKIALCSGFATLPVTGAAALLLHEALHSSGLRESPAYPGALTAAEITRVVIRACDLS